MSKHIYLHLLFAVLWACLAIGCGDAWRAEYRVRGVLVEYESYEIVRTQDRVRSFFDRTAKPFEDHFSERAVGRAFRSGWFLQVHNDRPSGGLAWDGQKPCGVTFPGSSSSVYHERFLDDGCGGHEIRLQLIHHIRGPAPEGADIRYINKHGLKP